MSADFPFLSSTAIIDVENLSPFREYAWDFEKDCFLYDGDGNHILLEGNEALKVWIYKALRTERFSYLAYSWRYGIELHKFIGKVMGVKERHSELKRTIIETLMVNPFIRSIDKIEMTETKHAKDLQIDITLTTVYGELEI